MNRTMRARCVPDVCVPCGSCACHAVTGAHLAGSPRPGDRGRASGAGPSPPGPVHSTEAPRVAAGASRGPRRREDADVHGTPDAARRQRAHLSRLLRAHQRAALDLEGRAGERGVRVLEHRPARLPGRAAGLRRDRLRPSGPDLPSRVVRGLQGDQATDAGRPARPVPEGARGGRGAPPAGLRDGGLRSGRRHRHPHARGRGARPRDHDRHRRPGHAPARHGPNAAHDDPHGRRRDGDLRPGADRGAVRPRCRPDDRLQGAQGQFDRQHPRRAGRGGQDRGEAHQPVRQPRHDVCPPGRGHAGEAPREASRAPRPGSRQPRARHDPPGPACRP